MDILAIIAGTLLLCYLTIAVANWWMDYKFRKAISGAFGEEWRRVPDPNWRSSRGGEYW